MKYFNIYYEDKVKKIPNTLVGRRKNAKFLQNLYPGYAVCKCCGMPWRHVPAKSISYSKGQGHSPMCMYCYHGEEVTFEMILKTYTTRGTWPHENFSEEQIEYVMDSLVKEIEIDPILRHKFLTEERERILNEIL